jgi:hypothetical protein
MYLFSALCSLQYPGVEFVLFTTRLIVLVNILPVLNFRTETRGLGAGVSKTSCCGGCDFLSDRSWLDIILGFGLCLLLCVLKQ